MCFSLCSWYKDYVYTHFLWHEPLPRTARSNQAILCIAIQTKDLHVQSEAKVHVTGNVYRHNPHTHYIRTGSLRWRTFDVVFKRRQILQGSTVSANKQCCAASGKPGNPFGQGGPMWNKCLQHVIGLPVCSGHNGISVGGDSSGLGFYSLMSLGLTLVIMTVEFEFLEEEGNVLLINVSLRGADLEVGVL